MTACILDDFILLFLFVVQNLAGVQWYILDCFIAGFFLLQVVKY